MSEDLLRKSSNPGTNTAAETIETAAEGAGTPHIIATGYEGTARDQIRASIQRVRGGEMGLIPALAGLVVLSILFGVSSQFFFSKLNVVNLMTQTAALLMLAIALTFVIILTEIDLSAGVTGGVGMAVFIILINDNKWNWIAALVVALLIGAVIGGFIGYFVAKIGIPSFVITLGLFLGFQGLLLVLLGDGGAYQVQTPEVVAIMNSSLPVWGGWLMLIVIIAVSLGSGLYDRRRRLTTGMPVRPISLLMVRVIAWVVIGGFLVWFMNENRSNGLRPIEGVPIVVPLALTILWVGQSMLDRTRFGLHIYAVGGNPEAARRAGINVVRIRVVAFILCSMLSVVAGLFLISQVGVVQSNTGASTVLQGVGAAVVGGVSLFGGRGRLVQAAVGAILISMIQNGLGLLNFPAGLTFLVTGGVLILAATIDALSRRRSRSTSLARS